MQEQSLTQKIWIKGQPSQYQLHDITHFPDWRGMIVWDFFLNNLTSGLTLITAIFWLCAPPEIAAVMPAAMLAALLILAADLILLVFDLADPPRFFHSLRVMHFTSALSVGVWALSLYGIFLGAATFFAWILALADPGTAAGFIILSCRNLFFTLAILTAIAIICYKGVVFSCSSQPGVRKARWLTPLVVSDSLLIGLAVYALICLCFLPRDFSFVFIAPMCVLIIFHCAAFKLMWNDVKARADKVYKHHKFAIFMTVHFMGGLLPLIFCFFGWLGMLLSSILVLCSGLAARYWIIGLTQPR